MGSDSSTVPSPSSPSTPKCLPSSLPSSSPRSYSGWKERILIPTVIAGVVGAGVGLLSKHRKVLGVGNICTEYATNLAVVAGCYCGAREFITESRSTGPDDILNSVAGGIMSGAILGRIQGGQLGAARYAVLFAAAGTAMDFATLRLKPVVMQKYRDFSIPEWSLPEWSPIQMLDEEALAAKRAREKQLYTQRVLDSLLINGMISIRQ